MQKLKERTARFVLKTLSENRQHAWCEKMLARFMLPASVQNEAYYRVWQRPESQTPLSGVCATREEPAQAA